MCGLPERQILDLTQNLLVTYLCVNEACIV